MAESITKTVDGLQASILCVMDGAKAMHEYEVFDDDLDDEMKGEMHANITLAYRHLEDARMRLGKVIQASDGGVSAYGKVP